MIVLSKNATKITINRHKQLECTKLKLVNNLTRKEIVYDNLVNTSESLYFYEFTVDMSQLMDGEYTVHLFDSENNEVDYPQLAVCGDYKKTTTHYQKQNNKVVYERDQI